MMRRGVRIGVWLGLLLIVSISARADLLLRASPIFTGTSVPLILTIGQYDEYNVTLAANTQIQFNLPVISGSIQFRINLCENGTGGWTPTFTTRSGTAIVKRVTTIPFSTNANACETESWTYRNVTNQVILEANSPVAAGGGSGSVTSVGLGAPIDYSVTGSPVTSTGTLSLAHSGQTCSANCTISTGQVTISAGSGNVTATLPPATGSFTPIEVCRTDGTANTVGVAPAGSDTIFSVAGSYSLSAQYQCVDLVDTALGFWSSVSERYALIPSSKLATTGVTAGTYSNANITVNAQGQLTSASSGSSSGGAACFNTVTLTSPSMTINNSTTACIGSSSTPVTCTANVTDPVGCVAGTQSLTIVGTTGDVVSWQAGGGGATSAGSTGNLQTNGGSGSFSAYAGSTCTNKAVTALNSSGTATCNTVTSAYVDTSIPIVSNNLSEYTATASTARTNLGMGTISTLTAPVVGSIVGLEPLEQWQPHALPLTSATLTCYGNSGNFPYEDEFGAAGLGSNTLTATVTYTLPAAAANCADMSVIVVDAVQGASNFGITVNAGLGTTLAGDPVYQIGSTAGNVIEYRFRYNVTNLTWEAMPALVWPPQVAPFSIGGTGTAYGPGQTWTDDSVNHPNDTVTGTTTNGLVAFSSTGKAISVAAGALNGVIGICDSGCGTSGTPKILTGAADHLCVFDNGVTRNDYVSISATAPGDCTDTGASPPSSGETIGRVDAATNAAAGTYQVFFYGPSADLSGSGGGGVNAPIDAPANSAGDEASYQNGSAATVSAIGKLIHAGPNALGLSAAFTALGTTSGTVILDPNVAYTVSAPLRVGNGTTPQEILSEGGAIQCTDTTGGRDCIQLDQKGTLSCDANGSNASSKGCLIYTSSNANITSLVTDYASNHTASQAGFRLNGFQLAWSSGATLSKAALWLNAVDGFAQINHVGITMPSTTTTSSVTGLLVDDGGTLFAGFWNELTFTRFGIVCSALASATPVRIVATRSGGSDFNWFGGSDVDCGSNSVLLTVDGSNGGSAGLINTVNIHGVYFESTTATNTDAIDLNVVRNVNLYGDQFNNGGTAFANCIKISGTAASTTGIQARTWAQGAQLSCTDYVNNTIDSYVNTVGGELNYDYEGTLAHSVIQDQNGLLNGFGPPLYYSAAGTAIPACVASNARLFACVSDSTACTSGTTYVSGGSTGCLLQCNNAGLAWKETGIACQ